MAYTISKHAEERYAERIMEKDNKCDAAVFIAEHKDKIVNDINKMIEFGKKIYSGKSPQLSQKNNNKPYMVDIYLNGYWVIIVGKDNGNVITLYNIDLQVDEELNQMFISKMMARIEAAENEYLFTLENNKKDIEKFHEIIDGNEANINEYKRIIKSLEETNATYKELIIQLNSKIEIADQNLREEIYKLIGKKSF